MSHVFTPIIIGATAFTGSYFGFSHRQAFLDVLHCIGHESTLLDCNTIDVSQPLCQDNQEVGVYCLGKSDKCGSPIASQAMYTPIILIYSQLL